MSTEIAKQQEVGQLALAKEINDLFGGDEMQLPINAPLPQIKVMRETPMFEMPDGEPTKEVVGHILYFHNANQYYETKFGDGEQGPPCCASSDGIKPDGGTNPMPGPCRGCPYNEYGSAKDKAGNAEKGKACQNTIRLYVLVDGNVIPCLVKASPSSLGKKESLLKWLTNAPNIAAAAGAGTHYQPIKVRFTLHKKDFSSGMSASVIDIATLRVLDPKNVEDMAQMKKLAKMYKDFMAVYAGRIAKDVANESAAPAEVNEQGSVSADINDDSEIPI